MAASTTPRYAENSDNTGRLLTLDYPTTAYAATLAIAPKKSETTYKVTLTGAMTVNATTTDCYADDAITFLFDASGGARIVTFGTNIKSAGTLTVASGKTGSARFKFNGASFIEISRFVEP